MKTILQKGWSAVEKTDPIIIFAALVNLIPGAILLAWVVVDKWLK